MAAMVALLVATSAIPAPLSQSPAAPEYVKHAQHFCVGNFDGQGHTFYRGNESLAACTSKAVAAGAACFDHTLGTDDAAVCRLTNYSTSLHASADGFDAYVDANRPGPPSPPISPGGIARYGCVAGSNTSSLPFCDTSVPAEARARALIALLTPEEKGALMTARTTARSNAIPRLGVPLFCWGQNSAQGHLQANLPTTSSHGYTFFPRAPGMAATWNLSAVSEQGRVYAVEARSIFNEGHSAPGTFECPGSVVLWGPTINLVRDPRWGRIGETASEDPLFNALYGAAYAEGAQVDADVPGYLRSIVTLKHWGAYSVDVYKNATVEYHRQSFDANVSAFDMADSYAPIFEGAVRGAAPGWSAGGGDGATLGGATGVMCSYNSVNGVPACADRTMQTTLLRDTWNFSGYVVGDSDTVRFIDTEHHYSDDPAGAVRAALHGGTDLESWTTSNGTPDYYRDVVPEMLRNGSLDASLVDTALQRLLTLRFRTGLFDAPSQAQKFFDISPRDRGTDEFRQIAMDAARQSVTLLRNENGTLPAAAGSRIALIGPYGTRTQNDPHGATLDAGLRTLHGDSHVTTVGGCAVNGDDESGFAAAEAAAAAAEVVVLALGCDPSLEHESKDRLVVTLPSVQSKLGLAVLRAARGAGARVLLILFNFGEISVDELLGDGGVDALLVAFWPSSALPAAEALLGHFSPGGKLPYTVYKNTYTDEVAFGDMDMNSGPGRTYRYFRGTPSFAFGTGMSLTRFTLALASTAALGGAATRFEISVHNVGGMAGSEVVQLYSVPPSGLAWDAPLPRRRLLDFRKLALPAGASATARFDVAPRQLRLVNRAGERVAAHGTFTLIFTNGNGESVAAPFVCGSDARPPILRSAPATGISFNTSLGSYAVLQQQPASACVYGMLGDGGTGASVALSGTATEVVAAVTGGGWKACFPPQPVGGDRTITATCKGCTNSTAAVLEHITFGDVYYCSGAPCVLS